MENYKFLELLGATPLSPEVRHNLSTIFHALSDTRKNRIIDHWDDYREKIVEIHDSAENERKNLVITAFSKIDALIDEAYRRDQERKKIDPKYADAQEKSHASISG